MTSLHETVGKDPQEWADFLASAIYGLTSEGERDGWVSELPPDAATRLKEAVDTYCAAYDGANPPYVPTPPSDQAVEAASDAFLASDCVEASFPESAMRVAIEAAAQSQDQK
jgi:hypothetical protein